MITLGIESTCDETACAILKDGVEVLSHVVASQHDIHIPYGGVFPELACRRHIEVLPSIAEQALQIAGIKKTELDLIAVAQGPGLIGALVVGMNFAKGLALGLKTPFIGVNHVEAHIYVAVMGQSSPLFPALGVVISGGHTFLCHMERIGTHALVGATVDDAIGEAFDKVAALLGLEYPGGPALEHLARRGNRTRYPFRAGRVKGKPWCFSFSGLKTSVLYTVKGKGGDRNSANVVLDEDRAHIAASFQEVALSDIVDKAQDAAKALNCRAIYVGGGVSCNLRLRELFSERSQNIPVFWAPRHLCTDNAVMIAGLGYFHYGHRGGHSLALPPFARLPLTC